MVYTLRKFASNGTNKNLQRRRNIQHIFTFINNVEDMDVNSKQKSKKEKRDNDRAKETNRHNDKEKRERMTERCGEKDREIWRE